MNDITFERTQSERTGDSVTTIQHDRSAEQEARVKALTKKIKRDYFDSGEFYKEMHKAQGGGV